MSQSTLRHHRSRYGAVPIGVWGGTALSRARRLIRRMSEDIDLKIMSASALTRPALRDLRDKVTDALLARRLSV
jgi:predicted nucleotidyltransferase component of viral defense system